jgi:hypothetical protein
MSKNIKKEISKNTVINSNFDFDNYLDDGISKEKDTLDTNSDEEFIDEYSYLDQDYKFPGFLYLDKMVDNIYLFEDNSDNQFTDNSDYEDFIIIDDLSNINNNLSTNLFIDLNWVNSKNCNLNNNYYKIFNNSFNKKIIKKNFLTFNNNLLTNKKYSYYDEKLGSFELINSIFSDYIDLKSSEYNNKILNMQTNNELANLTLTKY